MPEPQTKASHLSPVPAAVKRQADRAEQLQRESLGMPPKDAPAEAKDGEQPAAPPAANSQSETPGTPQPPAPAPTPPPPPPPAAELATVQGRLDAERERSQNLTGQIASLERMVSDLQRQMRQQPAAPPEPPKPKHKLVTAEEEAEYGADLIAIMGKRARDEVADEIDGLKSEIRDLKGMLGHVGSRVQARDETDLFSVLGKAVPGWDEQNKDQNFILWLQQPEPFSGIKRQDLLTRAFELKDAPRVVKFFQGYLDEAAATGQRPPATPQLPPANPASSKVPLETFAAPGRATPAPASAPSGERPHYTRAQISQFFTDKAAGKWRGREVEAANIEADIFRAGPEGRVIG